MARVCIGLSLSHSLAQKKTFLFGVEPTRSRLGVLLCSGYDDDDDMQAVSFVLDGSMLGLMLGGACTGGKTQGCQCLAGNAAGWELGRAEEGL